MDKFFIQFADPRPVGTYHQKVTRVGYGSPTSDCVGFGSWKRFQNSESSIVMDFRLQSGPYSRADFGIMVFGFFS